MSKRNVWASTACLHDQAELRARIALYKENGINKIELGAGVYLDNYNLTDLKDVNCNFLVHNYFPPPPDPFVINLASTNKVIRDRSIIFAKKAMQLTTVLGAPFYSIHAGFIADPVDIVENQLKFPSNSSKYIFRKAFNNFIFSVSEIAAFANKLNIQLLIENNVCTKALKGKLLLQTAEDFEAFFSMPELRKTGILLDTGHLKITAKTYGFDPVKAFKKLKPYISALHIHDNDGIADLHLPVKPGGWMYKLLKDPDFINLPVIIEARFSNVEELKGHFSWLHSI